MILLTENLVGNLHEAAHTINRRGLADYVLTMHYSHGNTVIVYRVQRDHPMVLEQEARREAFERERLRT